MTWYLGRHRTDNVSVKTLIKLWFNLAVAVEAVGEDDILQTEPIPKGHGHQRLTMIPSSAR